MADEEGVLKQIKDYSKSAKELVDAVKGTNDTLASYATALGEISGIAGILNSVSTQLMSPVGLAAMTAGIAVTIAKELIKTGQAAEQAAYKDWIGAFTLTSGQQQLFMNSFSADLSSILTAAKSDFEKILGLDETANTDGIAVEIEMMKLALEEGVIDQDQLQAMYDGVDAQLTAALADLDMELLRSKALAELNYSGSEKDEILADLEKERAERKQELVDQKTQFETFTLNGYQDVLLDKALGAYKDFYDGDNPLYKFEVLADRINEQHGTEMDAEGAFKGMLTQDSYVVQALVRETIAKSTNGSLSEQDAWEGLSQDPALARVVNDNLKEIVNSYGMQDMFLFTDLLELQSNVIAPRSAENQKLIDEGKASDAVKEQQQTLTTIENSVQNPLDNYMNTLYNILTNYRTSDQAQTAAKGGASFEDVFNMLYNPSQPSIIMPGTLTLNRGTSGTASSGGNSSVAAPAPNIAEQLSTQAMETEQASQTLQTVLSNAALLLAPLVSGVWAALAGGGEGGGEGGQTIEIADELIAMSDGAALASKTLQTTLTDATMLLAPLVTSLFSALVNGEGEQDAMVAAQLSAITQQFASFSAGLPTAFSSTVNASGIGQSFAQGIANGITSGTPWIRAAASAAAQAAKNAAQQALAINSPSKVGMQIGGYFGKGMALGIENMNDSVSAASRRLGEMAANGLHGPGVMGGGLSAVDRNTSVKVTPIDYDRLADAISKRPALFRVGDRAIAEATVDANSRALSRRTMKIVKGYGG